MKVCMNESERERALMSDIIGGVGEERRVGQAVKESGSGTGPTSRKY